MHKLICPGTFDPITNGHLDVIRRARQLCDHLIVLVLDNEAKKTVLSLAERCSLVKDVCSGMPGVSVESHSGLLVDYVRRAGAAAVVRGIRGEADYAYENTMAQANRALYAESDTIFIPASGSLAYMSSSIVRSVAWFGGDISGMVPPAALNMIVKRYAKPTAEDTHE